ncbi:hypothetical protein ABEB36_003289 [Hypothenemus hampei]|uniref:Reverse transcriptase domain-containing protein n=1 Tax=Hypothenemus hampei TaxID=57062 RepID=A0ABD1FBT4_HYPHA
MRQLLEKSNSEDRNAQNSPKGSLTHTKSIGITIPNNQIINLFNKILKHNKISNSWKSLPIHKNGDKENPKNLQENKSGHHPRAFPAVIPELLSDKYTQSQAQFGFRRCKSATNKLIIRQMIGKIINFNMSIFLNFVVSRNHQPESDAIDKLLIKKVLKTLTEIINILEKS